MDKKIVLFFADQFFKCIDMIGERFFTFLGCDIRGVWLFADELFFDDNIIFGFQSFRMAGEISIGHAEQFFQHVEIGGIIHHQNRHNAEPDPMVESLINILDDVFQNYFLSYLKYMIAP